MPSKEEILQRKNDADTSISTCSIHGYIEPIYEAMEEYAKQQSINFLDWVENNYSIAYEGFKITREREEISYVWTDIIKVRFTLSELYELYLLSKK